MRGDPTTDVRSLATLDLEGLRERWQAAYGAPPTLRSVDLLRRLLAWRMQADRWGGLSPQARRDLARRTSKGPSSEGLSEGVLITREWQGRRYEVRRIDGGYDYAGARYRSLSAVARAITGVRWNGPRFFGLRTEPDA